MFHVWAPSIDKLCSVLGVFCLCESLHCCHYRSRIWVSANFSPRLYIWYMYNYNLPLGHFSLAGAFLVPLERLLSCSSTDSAYSSTSSSSSSSITGWGKNLKQMNTNYCQVFKMCKEQPFCLTQGSISRINQNSNQNSEFIHIRSKFIFQVYMINI